MKIEEAPEMADLHLPVLVRDGDAVDARNRWLRRTGTAASAGNITQDVCHRIKA